MAKKDKLDPIYSPDYYRMEKLVKNPQFQTRLRDLKASWEKWGVPIPVNGFELVKDYHAWRERLLDIYRAKVESEEVHAAIREVDEDPSLSPTEKIWRRLEVQDKLSPPLPWSFIQQSLEEFGLDPKNEDYQYFLTTYIFFQQAHFSEAFFTVLWQRNEKTDQMELFLKLEPHTKLEHVEAFWKDRIAPEIKQLPGYVGKNKAWEEFDRDLRIYTVHQKIQMEVVGKGKRSTKKAIDTLTWTYLRKKHPDKFKRLTLSQVRLSTRKIIKKLGIK
jgi:hypothetical protein